MLETMAAMPTIGWLVQIPFYLLELLVGFVQAMVFMLLTAVFTLLICQHHDEGSSVARSSPINRSGVLGRGCSRAAAENVSSAGD